MYLNTFNLWAFDVDLPLCYDIGDYPVFVTTSLWRVITPSLWRQVRLEPFTLHYAHKSLTVWVKLLPLGPKDHMQKGYCVTRHSLLSMGERGKSLSVWVRLGRAKFHGDHFFRSLGWHYLIIIVILLLKMIL